LFPPNSKWFKVNYLHQLSLNNIPIVRANMHQCVCLITFSAYQYQPKTATNTLLKMLIILLRYLKRLP